jgi:hypothetical protein
VCSSVEIQKEFGSFLKNVLQIMVHFWSINWHNNLMIVIHNADSRFWPWASWNLIVSWEKIHNKDLHDSCTLVYMQDGGDIFGSLVLIVLFFHWWWQRKEKTQGRLSRRWVLRRKEARRREARAKNPNLILDGPR